MPRHFRARMRVRTTDEGGRKIGIYLKDYRPDLVFDFDPKWWRGAYLVPDPPVSDFDDTKVDLGESREVDFGLRYPEQVISQLQPGVAFRMMEGSIPVADCVITTVYQ